MQEKIQELEHVSYCHFGFICKLDKSDIEKIRFSFADRDAIRQHVVSLKELIETYLDSGKFVVNEELLKLCRKDKV